MERFDAIIIGSGQGGTPLSQELAKAGWKTALIEREHVGGTCINEGCTPTKSMVASARTAYLARRSIDFGVLSGPISVSPKEVRARKRRIVEEFRTPSEESLRKTANLELIPGDAKFVGAKSLVVNGRPLCSETVVIDVGCRPLVPNIPGLSETPFLTSTSIMELDVLPDHLAILGGGPIGLEFAQMFRRFGAEVTVIEHNQRFLPHEDEDVAEALLAILREDGIDVRLSAKATSVSGEDGGIAVNLTDGSLKASHLLVATGRRSNADSLNLKATGIATGESGFIPVDERLETCVPGIYAIGDVNGGPQFTHISYDDFRILRQNLLGSGGGATTGRLAPYTIFTDPQLGRVGLSEEEARKAGREVKRFRLDMEHVARAWEMSEARGFMKAVVDSKTEEILGCAVLGIEGGEVMAMLQIAMMAKLPYTHLREAIFAHPTLAESLNNLFSSDT